MLACFVSEFHMLVTCLCLSRNHRMIIRDHQKSGLVYEHLAGMRLVELVISVSPNRGGKFHATRLRY